jgi:hypothetical protein
MTTACRRAPKTKQHIDLVAHPPATNCRVCGLNSMQKSIGTLKRLWPIFVAACLTAACRGPATATPSAVPAGQRILGIDVSPAQDGDYPASLALAQAAGARCVTLSLNWTTLEPSPGRYDDSLLDIADSFYPARKMNVIVTLRPIDTDRIQMPSDLAGDAFDSPVVIARFEKLLDNVFAHTRHLAIAAIAVGNEVDASLGTDQAAWSRYERFYDAEALYIHKNRPGTPVGVVTTFGGLTGPHRNRISILNGASDVVLATYYPLNADFTVRPPTTVSADFEKMAAACGAKPLILTECGCPSGRDCGSSDAIQSEFVDAAFRAWDAHSSRIPCVVFTRMIDPSPQAVAGFTNYYGLSSPAFTGYLATLGLRTFPGAGTNKPAWTTLAKDSRARGF